MNWIRILKSRVKGLTDAIGRFPLTTAFLLAAASINAYSISTGDAMTKFLLACVVGAFLSAAAQAGYERFFVKQTARYILAGAVILLTAGYYLIIKSAPELGTETELKTAVALFALLILFIWLPVIKSSIDFNQSFMITFKAFFISLFFSGILFAGINIILSAINLLIFTISQTAYPHTENLVFIVFAPMYFLSLIPVYSGVTKQTTEHIAKTAHCPKFLEVLISYIIIPLLSVFTFILVIYIVKSIGGKFWTDNLLEPMLVSYAITVILVYILASSLENKFAIVFRKIFPKLLVPIVLFQITASLLSLNDTGVTHTRYYVILFGIFAALSGIALSFLPVRKNGIIALLLLICAAVSIIPPVDAFTVSRISQTNTLKYVLLKNNMLAANEIKQNSSLSEKEQRTITNTVNYLSEMGYAGKISWMPKHFKPYENFYETFGFKPYQEGKEVQNGQGIYLSLGQPAPVSITGYDTFVQAELYPSVKNQDGRICDFSKKGKQYTLTKELDHNQTMLVLMGGNGSKLITFNTQEIFDRFAAEQTAKGELSAQEATFSKENDNVRITVVVQNVGIEKNYPENNNAVLYVFVGIK